MENGTFAPQEQCFIFHNSFLKNLKFQRGQKGLVWIKGSKHTPIRLEFHQHPQSQADVNENHVWFLYY